MSSPVLLAALAGLLAGLIHAFSGPDHLSAVAPLVVGQQRRGWTAGLFWGMGHSLGVWGVGLIGLALRGLFPIERVSSWSERLVGAVLIAVGLWGLRRAWVARHPGVEEHGHAHHVHPSRPPKAALWIGTIHGLAGSSHILGIVPALALPSIAASLSYVIGFGLGAVVAMVIFSTALGLVAVRLTANGRAYQAMLASFSMASIVIGGYWLLTAG